MKPFHGITFCPTALDDATSKSISKKIIKLGGEYAKDLTRQCMVLVVGFSTDTNKYKFAVQYRYDIIFISYRIIDELYQLWLAGEDITLKEHSSFKAWEHNQVERMLQVLKARYSADPLKNFYLFVGRISSDLHSVNEIETISHELGCYKCEVSQFLKDAKSLNPSRNIVFITDSATGIRVNAARDQGIPIVHQKWIVDCQIRGAMLQFDPYYLTDNVAKLSFEEIGRGACNCWAKMGTKHGNNNELLNNDTSSAPMVTSSIYLNDKSKLINKFKPQGEKLSLIHI